MDTTFNIIPRTANVEVKASDFYNDKAWNAALEMQMAIDGIEIDDLDVWAFAHDAADYWNVRAEAV